MPDVRYMGKHHWTQTILDDDGKFKKFQNVAPGETISVDEDVAKRFLSGPRDARLFVAAGSSEDPNSEDYVRSKWDTDIIDGSGMYVSQDVGREFGSTSPDGRVIFRTEDDNKEDYPIAPPEVGPQSDNARLYDEDEAQAAAEAAREKTRASQSAKRSGGSAGGSSSGSSSSPAPSSDS